MFEYKSWRRFLKPSSVVLELSSEQQISENAIGSGENCQSVIKLLVCKFQFFYRYFSLSLPSQPHLQQTRIRTKSKCNMNITQYIITKFKPTSGRAMEPKLSNTTTHQITVTRSIRLTSILTPNTNMNMEWKTRRLGTTKANGKSEMGMLWRANILWTRLTGRIESSSTRPISTTASALSSKILAMLAIIDIQFAILQHPQSGKNCLILNYRKISNIFFFAAWRFLINKKLFREKCHRKNVIIGQCNELLINRWINYYWVIPKLKKRN